MTHKEIARINTPLGGMIAVADEEHIYRLEFEDLMNIPLEVTEGSNPVLRSITHELNAYFQGTLVEFQTPIHAHGSEFQNRVWSELRRIPFGHTHSYADIARALGSPTAFRAAANANGKNPIALVIPCHRVINADGRLGGYNGGIERKKWLLEHESRIVNGIIHP